MASISGGRLTTALAVVVAAAVAVPVVRRLGLGPVRGCGGVNQPKCREPADGSGGATPGGAAVASATAEVGGCGGVHQPPCPD